MQGFAMLLSSVCFCALCQTHQGLAANTRIKNLKTTMPTTATQYHTYEGRINASKLPPTPFGFFCNVIIDGPNASRHSHMNITMYHDGGQSWAWRFTPDVVGEWQWQTECEAGYGLDGHRGTLQSTASLEV